MTRVAVGALTLMLVLFASATQVAAQDQEFEIVVPLVTVVRAPAGSETELAVAQTPEGLVGESCAVSARARNQSSVHPGNDLVVASENRIVLRNVEAEPGGVVTAADTLVLSEEVTVTLIMGPDEVFSAGIDVEFECPPTDTTTTTSTTTTIAATTVTTEATTTSTAPATTLTTTGPTSSVAPPTSPPTSQAPTSIIEDEVAGTRVLPFTGVEGSELGLAAVALAASGVLLLIWARSFEAPTLSMYFTFGTRCVRCGADAVFATPHGLLCGADTSRALHEDRVLWMPKRLKRQGLPQGE